MTEPGRRERKKAATRRAIADTALRMFLERGYDAVGIREIAAAADVAITTLFAHFPSKEALVFDEDGKREEWLVRAVTDREPGRSVPQALRHQLHVTVRDFARPGTAPFWELVDSSPALREYASTMWLRHEDALAGAIAADLGLAEPSPACRAFARYVLGVYPLAREAEDPAAAVDEIFDLITPGWEAVVSRAAAPEPGPRPRPSRR
ncbi:TetR family transcriptional regulator [Actinoplanes sp. NBRC 14428]|uniref:TetR family transcriptional regulator n=1 Tax=Pseudosporangium ferrugineum TaxID=439699 RepID=A0A2T0SFD0_9ACTN|nr:TetR/AcrR family transcriptional regulator [Pseudosporangium ferrugineum]PRY32126.1 TetR family transcriptional regulator [Pseudosporangium ferrugineum]BCJ49631.1 TetR family transcriptional regulator [Actinoplanes sp. NBRC 14428]